eukprot:5822274-Prymnesium_polylepis.1
MSLAATHALSNAPRQGALPPTLPSVPNPAGKHTLHVLICAWHALTLARGSARQCRHALWGRP